MTQTAILKYLRPTLPNSFAIQQWIAQASLTAPGVDPARTMLGVRSQM